jgi:uncharacterized protein YwgA
MNFQAKNIDQFRQAGEVLYALQASRKFGQGAVSRVALQKLIYLSVVLSPIKEIIISFLRFQYNYRGPFNPDIQNIVDHLMGLGFVRITNSDFSNEKSILIDYAITEKGEKTVERLIAFDRESEKHWWITSICRLAINYASEKYDSSWSGLNRIVDIVYQDPTFLKGKTSERFRTGIDIGGEGDLTKELIVFTKDYISKSGIKVESQNERKITEIILVLFFEYMYSGIKHPMKDDRKE